MMRRLELPVDRIVDTPLKQGMARTGLGDPRDGNGMPIGWKFGATDETTPHVFLIVGSDDGKSVDKTTDQLIGSGEAAGFTSIYSERGDRLPNNEEHFGFRDDISQPGVRGRLSPRPDHVLTRRYFDAGDERARRFARPGQPLLWAGQFIFGYATQIDDDPGPGPVAIPPHPWMANGSCLVFRRLRQRVQAFREFAERCAAAATSQLGRLVDQTRFRHGWLVDGRTARHCRVRRQARTPPSRTIACW
jgi:deferrochelatase/peroxidase EfeB